MALSGRGSSPEDMLTLKALQMGVAAAVDNSGLTPPVLVAHSMAVSQELPAAITAVKFTYD